MRTDALLFNMSDFYKLAGVCEVLEALKLIAEGLLL